MASWFYNTGVISTLVTAYVICGLISLIGFFLSRKFLSSEEHMSIISVAQQTTLTFGTLFMAFWIAINWQTMDDLTLASEQEAHAISNLYSITKAVPDVTERAKIRAAAMNYLDTVINVEYLSLANGSLSPQTEEAFNNLVQTVYEFPEITDIRLQLAYTQLNNSLTILQDNRVKRLDFINGSLDGVMLVFFLVLVVLICFWNGCTRARYPKLALIALFFQNIIIVSSAWLVLEIDHPFQGYFKVDNSAFVHVKQEIAPLKINGRK